MTDEGQKCALCQEKEAIEDCHTCENVFCEDCLEEHRHCINCGGSGVCEWNVMRNSQGELDYLHGQTTGEKGREPCRRCEETGLEM